MNQSFKTFREASQYAARFCAENNTTATVQRLGNGWAVVPSDEFLEAESHRREEQKIAEQRRIAEQEAAKRAVEIGRHREAVWRERQQYINGLSQDALQALWDTRERDLTERELELIRQRLREALGIKPAERVQLAFCPDCQLALSSCTCKA